MPNTAEHKAEMHQLARERIAAGKPVWDRKIRLADVWRNEAMMFEQRRDAIVARIRASGWLAGYDEYDELPQVVEELSDATNGDEFDSAWDCIYDIADVDRVWIGTF